MGKGEETKKHILSTASQAFWKRSFNAVTVDDIAAEAGVNKATIYRYFPSKEGLAMAVLERDGAATIACIFEAAFAEVEDPEARVDAIYSRLLATHQSIFDATGEQYGCPLANLALEVGTDMPDLRQAAEAIFARIKDYYRDIVAAVQDQGRAQGWAAGALVDALMTIHHGALVTSRIECRPGALRDAAQLAKQLIR